MFKQQIFIIKGCETAVHSQQGVSNQYNNGISQAKNIFEDNQHETRNFEG